eukprot:Sspe_Gene.31246::Locus_15425_Transcript_1_1_Confidence_1.000_Length_1199::g.31246::m.31246
MASSMWATRVVYVLCGALYIVGAQELYYSGAGSMRTFLPPLPYFIGMMLISLFPPPSRDKDSPPGTPTRLSPPSTQRVMLRIAGLEASGYLTTYLGISYAGSTIYTIIYGSMSIVVALVRFLITRKTITGRQLQGMLVVTVGIVSTAYEGLHTPQASSIELGVMYTLLGCISYATEYVFLEEALAQLPMQTVLFQLGKYCTILFAILFVTVGLPHYRVWIEDQVEQHHGRPEIVVFLYLLLIPCSFLKNYAWMGVLRGDGAVATGIMQGLRSCLTFTLSAALFCSADTPNQCFTVSKGIATIFVTVGTVMYSIAPPAPTRTQSVSSPINDIL